MGNISQVSVRFYGNNIKVQTIKSTHVIKSNLYWTRNFTRLWRSNRTSKGKTVAP